MLLNDKNGGKSRGLRGISTIGPSPWVPNPSKLALNYASLLDLITMCSWLTRLKLSWWRDQQHHLFTLEISGISVKSLGGSLPFYSEEIWSFDFPSEETELPSTQGDFGHITVVIFIRLVVFCFSAVDYWWSDGLKRRNVVKPPSPYKYNCNLSIAPYCSFNQLEAGFS